MKPTFALLSAATLFSFSLAAPAQATLPTPSQGAAPREAQAYLFHAGASDVFEITSSMMAIQNSRNPEVRAYASMLIEHHTRTTNAALATAKSAGIMPPPPELTPMQKSMIGQLANASPAAFDRTYLQQQVPAHQQALALVSGYARNGDNQALRQAASGVAPIVQQHLDQARQLLGRVR